MSSLDFCLGSVLFPVCFSDVACSTSFVVLGCLSVVLYFSISLGVPLVSNCVGANFVMGFTSFHQ